jgi:hypothetical protein
MKDRRNMASPGTWAVGLAVGVIVFTALADLSASKSGLTGRFAGAKMTGAQVLPGPGDPDGAGEVVFQFRPPTRKNNNKAMACAFLGLDGIQDPLKVRIHKGRTGEVGPVELSVLVEEFDPPRDGLDASGCRFDLSPRQINAVRRHERRYYAELHTAEFPNGGLRGQIRQYTDEGEPR